MISEKTVELNLTTEWINYLGHIQGRVFYAIAPSQRLEGRLAIDVSVQSGASGILFQYKRAYLRDPVFEWRLNRTRRQDQHYRLLTIELLGFPVFYGLPAFTTPSKVAMWRRRLLTHTFWHRPSNFSLPGGPIGHHKVFYDSSAQSWWCQSNQQGSVLSPIDPSDVVSQLVSGELDGNLPSLIEAINKQFPMEESEEGEKPDESALSISILVAQDSAEEDV